jgi:hypothetical protein
MDLRSPDAPDFASHQSPKRSRCDLPTSKDSWSPSLPAVFTDGKLPPVSQKGKGRHLGSVYGDVADSTGITSPMRGSPSWRRSSTCYSEATLVAGIRPAPRHARAADKNEEVQKWLKTVAEESEDVKPDLDVSKDDSMEVDEASFVAISPEPDSSMLAVDTLYERSFDTPVFGHHRDRDRHSGMDSPTGSQAHTYQDSSWPHRLSPSYAAQGSEGEGSSTEGRLTSSMGGSGSKGSNSGRRRSLHYLEDDNASTVSTHTDPVSASVVSVASYFPPPLSTVLLDPESSTISSARADGSAGPKDALDTPGWQHWSDDSSDDDTPSVISTTQTESSCASLIRADCGRVESRPMLFAVGELKETAMPWLRTQEGQPRLPLWLRLLRMIVPCC